MNAKLVDILHDDDEEEKNHSGCKHLKIILLQAMEWTCGCDFFMPFLLKRSPIWS